MKYRVRTNWKGRLLLITGILICLCLRGQSKSQDVRLFYLGGQSNMSGFGYTTDLDKELQNPIQDVYIFQGNPEADNTEKGGLGIWETLQPGHGINFESDGVINKLSDRFGVELSFARKIKELYPNEKIAIIKYARNGSSLDSASARQWGSWEADYKGKTGVNQFDHFLTTVKNAHKHADIDNDGVRDNLIPSGIIWMQGESDTYQKGAALAYYDNLSKLLNLIQAAFRTDDVPIVLGKISDSGNNEVGKVWKYGELVQYAQERYAADHDHVTIVRSTQGYSYTDPYHYISKDYIDLGEKFADALKILINGNLKNENNSYER